MFTSKSGIAVKFRNAETHNIMQHSYNNQNWLINYILNESMSRLGETKVGNR